MTELPLPNREHYGCVSNNDVAALYDFILDFKTFPTMVYFVFFSLYCQHIDRLYITDDMPIFIDRLQLYATIITESYAFLHYCFYISLELINICRSKDNEFNVYNLSEILQLKRTLMDDANSTFVKSCFIICSVA